MGGRTTVVVLLLAGLLAGASATRSPPASSTPQQQQQQQQQRAGAASASGAPAQCLAPAHIGDERCAGEDLETRWAWSEAERRCKQFSYYGCGGNGNNFDSEASCLTACTGVTASGCRCKLTYEPVCAAIAREGAGPAPSAADLRTFGNKCLAECAGAAVRHTGPCIAEVQTRGPGRALQQSPGCICTKEYRPVCANGRTFANPCLARCEGLTSYTFGACSDGGSSGSTSGANPAIPTPGTGPCPCPRVWRPVCGTLDGGATLQTFSNDCVARCKGAEVRQASQCPEDEGYSNSGSGGSSSGTVGGSRPTGGAAAPSRPQADCVCTTQWDPVCGSDGKTYSNPCSAACSGVSIARKGECQKTPIESAPAPAPAPAPNSGSGQPGRPCICPKMYLPVCGADGKTYSHPCLARCAGVAVASQGPCGEEASGTVAGSRPAGEQPPSSGSGDSRDVVIGLTPASSPTESSGTVSGSGPTAPAPAPGPAVCNCPKDYRPVCGANGKTYSNACLAKCAGQRVASQGPCGSSGSGGAAAPAAGPSAGPAVCNCPKDYRPVCGANGKTYSNACLAKCAGQRVASEGPCTGAKPSAPAPPATPAVGGCVCPYIYAPVCAGDKTYSNACVARCNGATVSYEGPCTGDAPAAQTVAGSAPLAARASAAPAPAVEVPEGCQCGKEYTPLCGVDGKTYANPCLAKCANTVQAYPGPCTSNCASCPKGFSPICVATKNWGTRTFANCCFAKCSGVNLAEAALNDGACKFNSCVTDCNKQPRRPVCCGGRTYANACLAGCHGVISCQPGGCKQNVGSAGAAVACAWGAGLS